ncbi:uncharacterized protein EI90DRAFT_3018070 [Cantharellus anzutake]|uniref:uncharacterized protein n=1 Tax=Cantharellus anzutake TaxID=1750568 RepID=UPI001903F8A5|nr:uncharacterized protein EI90DRAFT_3018070 [Cantharellus anzutake]KAF8327568.1 hypothetical protein EI90DRAFT_3018070 [Cantharellus anzutake]
MNDAILPSIKGLPTTLKSPAPARVRKSPRYANAPGLGAPCGWVQWWPLDATKGVLLGCISSSGVGVGEGVRNPGHQTGRVPSCRGYELEWLGRETISGFKCGAGFKRRLVEQMALLPQLVPVGQALELAMDAFGRRDGFLGAFSTLLSQPAGVDETEQGFRQKYRKHCQGVFLPKYRYLEVLKTFLSKYQLLRVCRSDQKAFRIVGRASGEAAQQSQGDRRESNASNNWASFLSEGKGFPSKSICLSFNQVQGCYIRERNVNPGPSDVCPVVNPSAIKDSPKSHNLTRPASLINTLSYVVSITLNRLHRQRMLTYRLEIAVDYNRIMIMKSLTAYTGMAQGYWTRLPFEHHSDTNATSGTVS